MDLKTYYRKMKELVKEYDYLFQRITFRINVNIFLNSLLKNPEKEISYEDFRKAKKELCERLIDEDADYECFQNTEDEDNLYKHFFGEDYFTKKENIDLIFNFINKDLTQYLSINNVPLDIFDEKQKRYLLNSVINENYEIGFCNNIICYVKTFSNEDKKYFLNLMSECLITNTKYFDKMIITEYLCRKKNTINEYDRDEFEKEIEICELFNYDFKRIIYYYNDKEQV